MGPRRPREIGVGAEEAETGEEERGAVEGEGLAVVDEEGAEGGDAFDEGHFLGLASGGSAEW